MGSYFSNIVPDDIAQTPQTDSEQDPAQQYLQQLLEMSDDDFLDVIGDKLKRLIFEEFDLDMEPERYLQIANALRNALYWQGKQYLRVGTRPDESLGWLPLGITQGTDMGNNSYAAFRYVINIIRADGTKFTAVLGQRSPHVEAVANDTEDETDTSKASDANAVIRYLKDEWDADHLQKDIARHLYRTGPVFAHTFYNADPSLYGTYEVPVIENQDQDIEGYRCPTCQNLNDTDQVMESGGCASCGTPLGEDNLEKSTISVPTQTGTQKIPKGKVEIRLNRIFEATWPLAATCRSDMSWFDLEKDEHKAKLLACFVYGKKGADEKEKQRIEKIKGYIDKDSTSDITGSRQLAADAQQILLSQTVLRTQPKNMARYRKNWIRPEWYEIMRTYGMDSPSWDVVCDALWQKYPTGMRTDMIRGNPVRIYGESLDDVISVCKTGTDEKVLSDAWCQDSMALQDNINHFDNMSMETFLRMIPKTFVPADLIDRRSLEENDPTVAEYIFYNPRAYAGNIGNMIAKSPTGEVSAQLMPFGEYLRENAREFTGTPEQISGGGPTSNTFRSDLLKRNQALMVLGIPDDEMKQFWESAYYNGIKQVAKYATDVIKIPSQYLENGREISDLSALADGDGWHCEADEGLPLSHAEEREQLLDFINQNQPIVAQKLELLSDLNIGEFKRLLGIRGFKSRREMESKKFRQILKQLLLEGPIPGAPDPMTGQPGPPQPSVPIDMFEDDHEFMAQAARDFLNDSPGLRLKQSNQQAYQNILAFGLAHQRAEQAEPQAAPPGGPAGTPPKPGPPSVGGAAGAPGGAPLTAATKATPTPPPNVTAPPPPQQTVGAPPIQ